MTPPSTNRSSIIFVAILFLALLSGGVTLFIVAGNDSVSKGQQSESSEAMPSSAESSLEAESSFSGSSESSASAMSSSEALSSSFVSSVSPSSSSQTVSSETTDEATIRAFYTAIAAHEFEKAFAFYAKPKVSLKTFQSWYTDVTSTKILDLKEVSPHLYSFSVQLTEKLNDTSEYDVLMYVENEKVETKSSVFAYGNEHICRGELCATVTTTRDGAQGVSITLINAKKGTMVSGAEPGVKVARVRFSPTGRYLLFDREFQNSFGLVSNTFVYDINVLKPVDLLIENAKTQHWFFDDTRLVVCGRAVDSTDGYVKIFSLPDGKALGWETVDDAEPVCTVDVVSATVSWTSPGVGAQTLAIRTGERQ